MPGTLLPLQRPPSPPSFGRPLPLLHPLPDTKQEPASFVRLLTRPSPCSGVLVQDTTCTTFHGNPEQSTVWPNWPP